MPDPTPSPTSEHILQAAIQCHRAQRFEEAESLYRRLLDEQPNRADLLARLGTLLAQTARGQEAISLLNRAVEIDPLSPNHRTDLGVALQSLGRLDEAIQSQRIAVDLNPEFVPALINLGAVLSLAGKFPEAMGIARQAIKVDVLYPRAHHLLGEIQAANRDLDTAVESFRAALSLDPNNPLFHNSLGAALYACGDFEASLDSFGNALKLHPGYAEAFNNLGNTLDKLGQTDAAIAMYEKSISLDPNLAPAHLNLGNTHWKQGRNDAALKTFQTLAERRPDLAGPWQAIGQIHFSNGKWAEATIAFSQVAALNPDSADACDALGESLKNAGDLDGATSAFARAVSLSPTSGEIVNNYAMILLSQGRIDEALAVYSESLRADPSNATLASGRIHAMLYSPSSTEAEIAEAQNKWNALLRPSLPESHQSIAEIAPPGFADDRSPDRRLRIGYLLAGSSPSAARTLLPLISQHDRTHFVPCVYTAHGTDAVVDLLRPHASEFRDISQVSDEEAARIIRTDKIDILVDLSQHDPGNRLSIFARKPAPLQVTTLGCGAGTGLLEMNYRLADSHLDFPESDPSTYIEQTVNLPEIAFCYQPVGATPEPSPLPSKTAGYITFASLGGFAGISPEALHLWAQILLQIPDSRLLISAPSGKYLAGIRQKFESEHISPDRLTFCPPLAWPVYIARFTTVDICLDPYPFSNRIAACDSLWMGVPVISLAGPTAAGRTVRSILASVGLSEFAVRRPRQLIQTVISLANSAPRLHGLRQTLRQKMLLSPLMNSRRFARQTEAIYRKIWRTHYENQDSTSKITP